ncbi:MAG: hypothetical protein ACRBM6_27810 [Geminicoccales bacterium]
MIDSATSVIFAPLLPIWLLLALGLAILLITGLGLWRRARGSLLRAAMLGLGLLALANPVVIREERDPLDDVVLMVTDRSPSQAIDERTSQLDEVSVTLREQLQALPDTELVETTVTGEGKGGTRLFKTLGTSLAEIGRQNLSGVVIVSDGQVHDVPAEIERLGIDAPVHLLLTGKPDEIDRRLTVDEVPSYGVVGDPLEITFRVEELGPVEGTAPVPVILRQNGDVVHRVQVMPGALERLPIELDRAGQTVIELEAEGLAEELTPKNNRQVFFINGVRDRLRVLLVSGQPYPGLRVWRNLLKADPAVDLVHFTILRPPEKQDGTPIRELALIAFPSRELFEVKLGEFDLVIFDRYSRRGLLPLAYLDNVASYVEDGGALLEIAGPEFAHPLSLYRTPLARVLPARPSGVVYDQGFTPKMTEVGDRHPVTRGLSGTTKLDENGDTEPGWGRWFRQVDVEVNDSDVLMEGAADRPLLVLDRIGEGRVAQLLSDHAWLWARGVESGGPQGLLLRRLVHWLMQEPELEEEMLSAAPQGEQIVIERRSLDDIDGSDIKITSPAGEVSAAVLSAMSEGIGQAEIEAGERGLYRIEDGDLTTYAAVRPISAVELSDMRATADLLSPLIEATSGGVFWLAEEGLPSVRKTGLNRAVAGRDWIGFMRNERYLVAGADQQPLLPAILALALLLGFLGFAWYREGR